MEFDCRETACVGRDPQARDQLEVLKHAAWLRPGRALGKLYFWGFVALARRWRVTLPALPGLASTKNNEELGLSLPAIL